MNSESIIAIVSVISTAIVSILSILVPVFIDREKRKHEDKVAEIEEFRNTTLDLLDNLSKLLVPNDVSEPEKLSKDTKLGHYTNLATKLYAWELAIRSRLETDERIQLRELRRQIQLTSFSQSNEGVYKNLDRVLPLTDVVITRVNLDDAKFLSNPRQLWLIIGIIVLTGMIILLIISLQ